MSRSAIKKIGGTNYVTVLLSLILSTACCFAEATKVACLGDSITRGRGPSAYPSQLSKLLGEAFEVKNFGRGGIPLARYDQTKECQNALGFQADTVIIMLGTNDAHTKNWKSKAFFKEKLKSLMAGCRKANPKVAIYLCTPLPIFRSKWGHDAKQLADEIVPTVKEVAAEEKCELIDLNTLFLDKESLMKDGVHPKGEGYTIIAKTVAGFLKPERPDMVPRESLSITPLELPAGVKR
jgi:lysophospholipase L1-like esterase